jgi:hypothetical protein
VTATEIVHQTVNNDDKQGVTVIAAISRAGEQVPLKVTGKGKTLRYRAGHDLHTEL